MHEQVDSGYGFTCDKEILKFIQAFYAIDMETLGSCQAYHGKFVGIAVAVKPKNYPRRWIAYTCGNSSLLWNFAKYLRDRLEVDGWNQEIKMDHYTSPDTIFATLEFVSSLDKQVLDALQKWTGN